jgi:hypothetical protein
VNLADRRKQDCNESNDRARKIEFQGHKPIIRAVKEAAWSADEIDEFSVSVWAERSVLRMLRQAGRELRMPFRFTAHLLYSNEWLRRNWAGSAEIDEIGSQRATSRSICMGASNHRSIA